MTSLEDLKRIVAANWERIVQSVKRGEQELAECGDDLPSLDDLA